MCDKIASKEILEKLLYNESSFVNHFQFLPHEKGKSDLWKRFKVVYFNGVPQDFARCDICLAFVTYSSKTGTGGLLRHKCYSVRNNSYKMMQQHRLQPYQLPAPLPPQPLVSPIEVLVINSPVLNLDDKPVLLCPEPTSQSNVASISDERKRLILDKQLKHVVKEGGSTDDSCFRSLCQTLIDTGAEYGRISVEDVFVSRQTLLRTHASESYERTNNEVVNLLFANVVSFVCHTWTDHYNRKCYVTLSGRMVSECFKMKRFVLGTKDFDVDVSAEKVRGAVVSILSQYVGSVPAAEAKLYKGTVVTSNDDKMVAAFRAFNRIPCMCHSLDAIMEELLDENEAMPETKAVLKSVKKLMLFLQNSGFDSAMSKSLTLKEDDKRTRWKATYYTLRAMNEMYVEIQTVLLQNDALFQADMFNIIKVRCLLEFADMFKQCADSLSSHLSPTAVEVVLWKLKFEKHCKPLVEDSTLVAELKRHVRAQLPEKYCPHILHYVALFLDPNFKKMKKLIGGEERSKTICAVQDMLKELIEESRSNDAKGQESMRKRKKGNNIYRNSGLCQKFWDFRDSSSEEEDEDEAHPNEFYEVENYLSKSTVGAHDILEYWKHEEEFPNLRQLARRVLSIPVTCMLNDSARSKVEQIMNDPTLQTTTQIEKVLFLHHNLD